jgi:hypothetical protein
MESHKFMALKLTTLGSYFQLRTEKNSIKDVDEWG